MNVITTPIPHADGNSSPSGRESRPVLGEGEMTTLREFFELLDRWDSEGNQHEAQ